MRQINQVIAASLMALLMVGCSEPNSTAESAPVDMSFDTPGIKNWPQKDQQKVTRAIGALVNSCPLLSKYWQDIVAAEALLEENIYYPGAKFKGWQEHVLVEITIQERPELIPKTFRASGHHCFYFIGEGQELGMYTNKEPCEKLCGLPNSGAGTDSYMKLSAIQ